ncbi:cold shock domain-containing protein [Comamonas sp. J-3]|jgi:CspA family cold shock protein|uniref:cold shock domain-containing protein n=1 Tax=Comamonas trifloxystrobinivorans TaxID=3350256 RepID=UPI00372B612D
MTNLSESSNRETGTIKCFFPFKGFGFISRIKGKDLFFFYKDLNEEWQIYEGAKVVFTVHKNKPGKGPFATDISRIG